MSHLILEHLTSNELPTEWAKQLPAGHTFSVMIVPERVTPLSNTPALDSTKTPLFGIWRDYEACQDVDSYVRHLRRNRFENAYSIAEELWNS
jgi:hypothetical protein